MLPQLVSTLIRLVLQTILGKERYRRARGKYFWVKKHGLRYHSIYGYREVEGWLSEKEAFALYDVAKSLPDDCVVVEIGSWLGKSSVILSQAIKRKRGAKLFCIDPFSGDGEACAIDGYRRIKEALGVSLLSQFTDNVRKYGSRRRVRVLEGYSYDFARSWHRNIDLLLIDGNHSYPSVLRDFQEWSIFIKPYRYCAFHDVSFDPEYKHDGPLQVVKQCVMD